MAHETSPYSRRDFLRLAAKSVVVSSGLLSGCATVSPGGGTTASRAIDIHHHYIPLELIDEVKRNGKALGVEYFPPKDAKANPFQIQFPNSDDELYRRRTRSNAARQRAQPAENRLASDLI